MSLRYYVPQSSLYPHVRSFAILEEPAAVFNKRIILPDSYPALMINLGAPLLWELDSGRQVELPPAFLVGIQTRVLKMKATGPCYTLGLNLSAWGTRFLLDEHTSLTEAPIIPLDQSWRDLARLLERTSEQRGDLEALAVLQQFVADRYQRAHIDVTIVRAVVERLAATNGACTLDDLAAHCALSPSQLARYSRYFTGQTPKALSRIIRFDAICAALLKSPANRLTDLAYQYGYVDQAHFVHEFKAFAACTPREARAYVRQLAEDAEFIQFS
jgi:AraC-like DNA-binding protein